MRRSGLFIAQAYRIHLDFSQQVLVLTAALAAIGAAGTPEAGLVTMVMVLSAVGLPLEGVEPAASVGLVPGRLPHHRQGLR